MVSDSMSGETCCAMSGSELQWLTMNSRSWWKSTSSGLEAFGERFPGPAAAIAQWKRCEERKEKLKKNFEHECLSREPKWQLSDMRQTLMRQPCHVKTQISSSLLIVTAQAMSVRLSTS